MLTVKHSIIFYFNITRTYRNHVIMLGRSEFVCLHFIRTTLQMPSIVLRVETRLDVVRTHQRLHLHFLVPKLRNTAR